MKLFAFIFFAIGISTKCFAQQKVQAANDSKPAERLYQVSGLVKDSIGEPISGAKVKLKSAKDSLVTTTDDDGIFTFNGVHESIFTITIDALGHKQVSHRYLNNYLKNIIVLDPIILISKVVELSEVKISGSPSIKYKVDTVEYKASDYTVPPAARVDELLKKMEGMEVGKDGTLIYQGQEVVKAKLNGKEFSGGEVKQAIQTLPADIVEKIQIIDDYGDFASKTGIKDGLSKKTLNITTKPEKSIGTFAFLKAQAGNKKRYKGDFSLDNINANRVLHFGSNLSNMISGIASVDPLTNIANDDLIKPVSQGSTITASPTVSYANDWNNKVLLVGSYSFDYIKSNALINSYGENFYSKGSSSFTRDNFTRNSLKNHSLNLKIDYNLNKLNLLQFTGTYGKSSSLQQDDLKNNNLSYFNSGFEHQILNSSNSLENPSNNFEINGIYLHLFKKPRRILSLQIGVLRENNKLSLDTRSNYFYFEDATQNQLVKDSLTYLLTIKNSNVNVFRSTFTYVEPINEQSRIELAAYLKKSIYHNDASSESLIPLKPNLEIYSLDNNFKFFFTDSKFSIAYRYNGVKSDLSIGIAILPTVLKPIGYGDLSHTSFRLNPVLRYSHSWSSVERFQFNYSGYNSGPNVQQIQPFTDYSDPNNIIVGNPDLNVSFTHNLTSNYNRYFPNKKVNFSANLEIKIFEDQILPNIYQLTTEISKGVNRTINITDFINRSGSYATKVKYTLSKQLNDRRFGLSFNGDLAFNKSNAISNFVYYYTNTLQLNERLIARININDRIELNPYFAHQIVQSKYSLLNVAPVLVKVTKLAFEGKFNFWKGFQFNCEINKNFVNGLDNYTSNPLIVNFGFEKYFTKQRSLVLTLDCFDLLHQNNYIQQFITPQSRMFTVSNPLSRFFLLGLRLNLQRWGGTPQRNGQQFNRRGDGSFIN